ncbi:hypothetical protein HHI36_018457 [Cryptolaemus montrouzieri]|uniref:Uncharacterized protein n=1 Tax=Cryptolaemus montrouzieri TaxID=559131 RepID=A0ABD2P088_9CUCU
MPQKYTTSWHDKKNQEGYKRQRDEFVKYDQEYKIIEQETNSRNASPHLIQVRNLETEDFSMDNEPVVIPSANATPHQHGEVVSRFCPGNMSGVCIWSKVEINEGTKRPHVHDNFEIMGLRSGQEGYGTRTSRFT